MQDKAYGCEWQHCEQFPQSDETLRRISTGEFWLWKVLSLGRKGELGKPLPASAALGCLQLKINQSSIFCDCL